MRLYICGPMTNIPQFNVPRFQAVAAWLRDEGYEVISPVELDAPEIRNACLVSPDGKPASNGAINGQDSWGQLLGRDVAVVADTVDGVAMLPGWERSRGARLEVFTALLCGRPLFLLVPSTIAGEWIVEPYSNSDALLDIALSFNFNPGVTQSGTPVV